MINLWCRYINNYLEAFSDEPDEEASDESDGSNEKPSDEETDGE